MTKRRAIQLAKRIEAWQTHLTPLGLAAYRIESVSTTDLEGHLANVTPASDYDSVWFEFDNGFVDQCYVEGDFDKLDQIILHEWVHVAFKDYYRAIQMVEDQLSDPMIAGWKDVLEHANEALVDRMARQLYSALKDTVVL